MTLSTTTPDIADLVAASPTIASLPSVYTRISDVIDDPYTSAPDLEHVISEDPGLTARLVRLVNSAFYNLPQDVYSGARGLSVIGLEQLSDLALATSVISMFDDIPVEWLDMKSFWEHSLATGVVCRVLATLRREANVERFFVSGLLHDIGRLLMLIANPNGYGAAITRARTHGELLYESEEELQGYNHAQVGAALLKEWGLPTVLQQSVAHHHSPDEAGRFAPEASVVHIADITAHGLLEGESGEHLVPPLSDAAWSRVDGGHLFTPMTFVEIENQYTAAVQAMV